MCVYILLGLASHKSMNLVKLASKLCVDLYIFENLMCILYVDCCSGPESFSSPVCPSDEDYNFTIQSPDELKSLYLVSNLLFNLFDCLRCSSFSCVHICLYE